MLPIVGILSTYAEGPLGVNAARTLRAACDWILIGEGPIRAGDGSIPREAPHHWKAKPGIQRVLAGRWESDAAKRTELLMHAQAHQKGPFWAVWLDGDEALIWPEHLRLWCYRAELEQWDSGELKVTGGFPIRLVELDGTTVQAQGRVYRGDLVERYLHSSVEVRLKGRQASMPLPNIPNWTPAYTSEAGRAIPAQEIDAYNRPPLQGEPHILHLSALRDPGRTAERQSQAELDGIRAQAERMGVALPEWAQA